MGDDYFVAYNSDHIGRGFIVHWKENEKNEILLRALNPCHPEELNDFFNTVKRITDYWKCDIEVDGDAMDVKDFLSNRVEYQIFNVDVIKNELNEITSGIKQNYTFPCVMFPLTIGQEEAIRFEENIDEFFDWLHNKQSIDAYYGVPRFYKKGDNIISARVLSEETRSIFPIDPNQQIELMNVINNDEMKCDENLISLYSYTEDEILGTIPYQHFIEYVSDKCERFDEHHIIIDNISHAEIEEMLSIKNEM